MQFLGN